ncbi:MAG TPA: hypothetical protein VLA12_19165, partial [Planctomycetaceae bacterium]|nr:hypothetical protein [Planctomycetaceae bacterium]
MATANIIAKMKPSPSSDPLIPNPSPSKFQFNPLTRGPRGSLGVGELSVVKSIRMLYPGIADSLEFDIVMNSTNNVLRHWS